MATTDFIIASSVVLSKIDYAEFKTWPENEQAATTVFLFAWWKDIITNHSYFDLDPLLGIYKLTGSLDKLLDLWKINFDDCSLRNYIEFVERYYEDLNHKKKVFKVLDETSIEQLINWVKSNVTILENAFFHFEKLDKELAEDASNTLYIIERLVG